MEDPLKVYEDIIASEEFNEDNINRHPEGSSKGGQFAPKDGGDTALPEKTFNPPEAKQKSGNRKAWAIRRKEYDKETGKPYEINPAKDVRDEIVNLFQQNLGSDIEFRDGSDPKIGAGWNNGTDHMWIGVREKIDGEEQRIGFSITPMMRKIGYSENGVVGYNISLPDYFNRDHFRQVGLEPKDFMKMDGWNTGGNITLNTRNINFLEDFAEKAEDLVGYAVDDKLESIKRQNDAEKERVEKLKVTHDQTQKVIGGIRDKLNLPMPKGSGDVYGVDRIEEDGSATIVFDNNEKNKWNQLTVKVSPSARGEGQYKINAGYGNKVEVDDLSEDELTDIMKILQRKQARMRSEEDKE